MVRIGTYLQVFYDSQWEQRLEKFEGEANWIGTNTILGILYVLLGLVSCFLLHAVGSVSNDQEVARWVFNISVAIFLVSVLSTIFYSYDRTGFLKKWISVPDKDSNPTVPSKD